MWVSQAVFINSVSLEEKKKALIFIWRNLFQWQSSLGVAICQSLLFFPLLKQAWESCETNATQGRADRRGIPHTSLASSMPRGERKGREAGVRWRKVQENTCVSTSVRFQQMQAL